MNFGSIPARLTNDDTKTPIRATKGAAGFDLYAAHDLVISHGSQQRMLTGISLKIPYGLVGIVKPRSGLAFRLGLDTGAGVIDSDYRGEIGLLFFNHNTLSNIKVNKGDRVAQIIIMPYYPYDIEVVECSDTEWNDTDRGDSGFGSTGK